MTQFVFYCCTDCSYDIKYMHILFIWIQLLNRQVIGISWTKYYTCPNILRTCKTGSMRNGCNSQREQRSYYIPLHIVKVGLLWLVIHIRDSRDLKTYFIKMHNDYANNKEKISKNKIYYSSFFICRSQVKTKRLILNTHEYKQ